MRSFGIAATLLSAVYAVYAEIFTVMVAPDDTVRLVSSSMSENYNNNALMHM